MRRPPLAPSLWLSAAVLLLVAAVTLVRGVEAAGGVLLTGSGERAHYEWAAGDPRLEERLAATAASLPPGVGLRLIVPAGTELGWATFRGLYHLPQQRVLGVYPADGPPPPRDAWTVDLTEDEPRVIPPQRPSSPDQR